MIERTEYYMGRVFVFDEERLESAFAAYCEAQGFSASERDLKYQRLMAFFGSEQALQAKLWRVSPGQVTT